MLSDKTMAYGEQATTALLGVDALYRAESGDEEGLVLTSLKPLTLIARLESALSSCRHWPASCQNRTAAGTTGNSASLHWPSLTGVRATYPCLRNSADFCMSPPSQLLTPNWMPCVARCALL
jgi:hypothetical protein